VSPKNPNVIFSISSLSSSPNNSDYDLSVKQPSSSKQTIKNKDTFFLSDDDDENTDTNLIITTQDVTRIDLNKKLELSDADLIVSSKESPKKEIAIGDISLEKSAEFMANAESDIKNDMSLISSSSSNSSSCFSSSDSSDSEDKSNKEAQISVSKLDEAVAFDQFGFDLSDEEIGEKRDEQLAFTFNKFIFMQEEGALKELIKEAVDEKILVS
jgi:hypothetical protein